MSKKVIIIGGGVAGLSAGIYARLNGFDTEIIEMHSIAGGQCTAWERKGYRFDYCLHWLVGTRNGPFHDIWRETGVLNDQVEIVDHEVNTKAIAPDGREFIMYTNIDRWEKYLCEMAPEDTASIRRMCSDMRKSAFLSPLSDPAGLRKLRNTIPAALGMLPIMMLFMKYGRKDCRQYFKRLKFKNPNLLYFFDNMFGSRDFSALAFIMMFAWFSQKNAGYLVGGSLPMTQRMTERYQELGGKLTFRKSVQKILVENNEAKGVVLSDGTTLHSDYVISAADGHATIFDMLEGKYVSRKIRDAYRNWKLFTPIVQVSFGINRQVGSDVPAENCLAPDQMIGKTKTTHGYAWMNYGFDPTMAPKGKSVIVMRYESPWELWQGMTKEAYNAEKEAIERDARALLEKRHPGVTPFVEVVDVATPLTDHRYTGVWKGAYEGFLPSAKNMLKNLNPVLPGLGKFYMAGQWLFPGGGLPPAGQSGKWAVQFICKEEGRQFATS
jgi:phytoene dehydrogenase-like protein